MVYNFEIKHKSRLSNKVADALPRQPVGFMECSTIVTENMVDWTTLEQEIERDDHIKNVRQGLSNQEGLVFRGITYVGKNYLIRAG